MSDILLIFPRPSQTSPQQNPAISIFYPGEAAAKAGYSVEYWDERIDDFEDLKTKVSEAEIIGISSLSGFMLSRTVEILKWCKKHYPKKPTILGGVHATFLSENSLKEPFIDYVVMGEGEERLPKLLDAIFHHEEPKIDGVGYKKNGRIIVNPRTTLFDFSNNYVSPVSEKTEKYFLAAAKRNEIILPVSRGCPWANNTRACSFCSVRDQYLGSYRHIPFEKWVIDLNRIYKIHPFSLIEMEDENSAHFVNHPEYAEALQKKRIRYHLHMRADQLQNEVSIRRIAETGCHRIHVGVESGNVRVRNEIYKKGENKNHFIRAAELLAKYGIEGVYTYIIGAPTETKTEMMETIKLSDILRAIHPKGKSRSTIYVLMALPGTEIFGYAKENGWTFPQTMEEWSKVSAAYNPVLPKETNNIYLIGGLHHNWYHKTRQNFPGLWVLLIAPFQLLVELRWKLGFFKFFRAEKFIIEKLIFWRSKKSKGQETKQ